MKCVYTNACSMGNKQEELKANVWQANYDLVIITEIWWDNSHDWSAVMDGYKLFRGDRQERRGGVVALYFRECFDVVELGTENEKVESIWVRVRGRDNEADILVGDRYRLPNQNEDTDEVFYKQLAEVALLSAFVLMGALQLP